MPLWCRCLSRGRGVSGASVYKEGNLTWLNYFCGPQSWALPRLSAWSLCGFRWSCQLLTAPPSSAQRLWLEHLQGSVWSEQSLPIPFSEGGKRITKAWNINSRTQ